MSAPEERYAELLEDLGRRWPESRIEPSLSRIRSVMDLLGDPQQSYPVIHVAGTNGKTSTARVIESILRAVGLRTGLYTSPHLVDVRERILLDGEPIAVETFAATYDDIAPLVDLVDSRSAEEGGPPLTYFELLTAIAFAAFADAPVDVAVVEVGLGGSWDATNVADGTVAVVTPVDLDHTELLGDTVALIAEDKAGIIKPGAIAVIGPQETEAAEALLRRCADVGASVVRDGVDFGVLRRDVAVGGQVLVVQGIAGVYEDLFLPLFGAHQASNAAAAVVAVEAFLGGGRTAIDADVLRDGIAQASSPGRLEVVRSSPTIIVDAAHNPHGAEALAAALADSFDFDRLVAVVAVLDGKDAHGVLEALEPVAAEVVVTQNSSPRCLAATQLAEIAEEVFGDQRVAVVERLDEAIDEAVRLAEADGVGAGIGVLVTGSVVTAGDARRLLAAQAPS